MLSSGEQGETSQPPAPASQAWGEDRLSPTSRMTSYSKEQKGQEPAVTTQVSRSRDNALIARTCLPFDPLRLAPNAATPLEVVLRLRATHFRRIVRLDRGKHLSVLRLLHLILTDRRTLARSRYVLDRRAEAEAAPRALPTRGETKRPAHSVPVLPIRPDTLQDAGRHAQRAPHPGFQPCPNHSPWALVIDVRDGFRHNSYTYHGDDIGAA